MITSVITSLIASGSIFYAQLICPISFTSSQLETYNTAKDIPKELISDQVSLFGRVEKVIDGDTLRIRHYPLYPIQTKNEFEGKLSENTIIIRLYGIDAPEIGKFGYPSMPLAEEARDWTHAKCGKEVVNVKLLRTDQYSRVIGKVVTTQPLPKNQLDLSIGLASEGYATLYTGRNAEYDGNREVIEKSIEIAQISNKGMWENGVIGVQTPAEYKRAIKQARAAKQAKKTTNTIDVYDWSQK